jgi:Co/Zn/Cd efflux system component
MLEAEIVKRIEADADNRVADLRLWRIGGDQRALILSVVTHQPQSAEHYKGLLAGMKGLEHVTIEVFVCRDEPCLAHARR